nr:DUF2059 domain-containing protein [Sulfitobacter aestuariivivens]
MAQPVWADARMTILIDFLRLEEAAQILADEGKLQAEELQQEMLDGHGGPFWTLQVNSIYRSTLMVEAVRASLEQSLNAPDLEEAIAFYGSELGQRIVTLENAARAAIIDKAVEAAARARYTALTGEDDPRLALIIAFAETGDMINRNVTSSMNSSYQFMRGMAEGGALEMSEDEILSDVAADLDDIRTDTEEWLYGYFLMAYNPLSDEDLRRYIAFSEGRAGQALNRGLFDGFGQAYETISYVLGQSVARAMLAEEL